MLTRYRHRDVVWIDLESPTQEEVRSLMAEYHLPPEVAEETLRPTIKPRVEFYEGHLIYLILHFPAFKHTHSGSQNQEVDFIMGKDFLITTRYDTIDPLHKFSKVFEVNSILDKNDIGDHAGQIFFYMIRKLYRSLEHELEYMQGALREIEGHIFEGREREMVSELSQVSRDLINFKQALSFHKEILESFEVAARRFFGENFMYELKTILGSYYHVEHAINLNLDTLAELRETNNALLTTKQNEIMKLLTMMTFMTAPLSLIAAIYSMNTSFLPIAGLKGDFWIIIGGMALIVLCLFFFFVRKRWF
jgi:magnesium transporter